MNMESILSQLVLSDRRGFRIGRHVLFWFVCWVFFGIIYGNFWRAPSYSELNMSISFIEALFFLPSHMFLTYSIIYFLIPRFLYSERYGALFVGVLVCILLTIIIGYGIAIVLVDRYRLFLEIKIPNRTLFYSLMAGLRGNLTVGGFAVAIKLVKMWYLKKQAMEKLEKEKLKAELAFLRGQLQPHFIFNSLNSIYSMALKNEPQTATALLRLSQLLRYSISESEDSYVSLERELNMLKDYIQLQQGRFGERLHVSLTIEGDVARKKIAPLLLLPIFENAFKYGTDEVLQEGWISIAIKIYGNELTLTAMNAKASDSEHKSHLGIGLQNVRKRMELLYPQAHELRMWEEGDVFITSVQIKLDRLIYYKDETTMLVG